jgi:hypothetical protein
MTDARGRMTDARAGAFGALDALRRDLDERAPAAGVERAIAGSTIEYRVGGEAVVVFDPVGLSYRLGAAVAQAAAGTAGASASPRGPDWVRLAPSAGDRSALDRSGAWFDLAVRLASGPTAAG